MAPRWMDDEIKPAKMVRFGRGRSQWKWLDRIDLSAVVLCRVILDAFEDRNMGLVHSPIIVSLPPNSTYIYICVYIYNIYICIYIYNGKPKIDPLFKGLSLKIVKGKPRFAAYCPLIFVWLAPIKVYQPLQSLHLAHDAHDNWYGQIPNHEGRVCLEVWCFCDDIWCR
jgi:hypothetical protein